MNLKKNCDDLTVIKLTKEERHAIWNALNAYANYHETSDIYWSFNDAKAFGWSGSRLVQDERSKGWRELASKIVLGNKDVEEELAKAAASSRIWFGKKVESENVPEMLLNKLKEHIKQSRDIEVQEFECVCIPIPKPGEHVSFPVACVTGFCFKKWGQIYRWVDGKLHQWISGQWRETNLSSTETQGEFVVVEEPEPVWKDCNFIEAVEWMKKKPTENKACWNNSLFHVDADTVFDEAKIPLMSRENEIEPVLGKWQILAQ